MEISRSACVVGAGMIGRHHASSLLASGFKVSVIDPINPHIDGAGWFKCLSETLILNTDFFIVSTTSKFHFDIVKSIMNCSESKVVVVEKPLFCTAIEYDDFDILSIASNHQFFCNVPYYYNQSISDFKNKHHFGKLLSYSSTGNRWGLCCNILHDMSILDAFSDIESFEMKYFRGDLISYEDSKRTGYYEVFGDLSFILNDVSVSVSCLDSGPIEKSATLVFESGAIKIDFVAETIDWISNGEVIYSGDFLSAKASETTGTVATGILNKNTLLPSVAKYSQLSKPLYTGIMSVFPGKYDGSLEFPFS